jgi:hypothetical protein
MADDRLPDCLKWKYTTYGYYGPYTANTANPIDLPIIERKRKTEPDVKEEKQRCKYCKREIESKELNKKDICQECEAALEEYIPEHFLDKTEYCIICFQLKREKGRGRFLCNSCLYAIHKHEKDFALAGSLMNEIRDNHKDWVKLFLADFTE